MDNNTEIIHVEPKKNSSGKKIVYALIIIGGLFLIGVEVYMLLVAHKCAICNKLGIMYEYMDIAGQRYYACEQHEDLLRLAGDAWSLLRSRG